MAWIAAGDAPSMPHERLACSRMAALPDRAGHHLNLSKGGVSTSLGVRGAHMTFGRRGRRETVGLPGSGLYATRNTPRSHPGASPGSYLGHFALGVLFVLGILALVAALGH